MTLIAAYRVLGGSFTGDLTLDPAHRRDLRRRELSSVADEPMAALDLRAEGVARSDRTRHIRDAVEAAMSDIILLGTEEHVRLADKAFANWLRGTRSIRTSWSSSWSCRCVRSYAGTQYYPSRSDLRALGTHPSGIARRW